MTHLMIEQNLVLIALSALCLALWQVVKEQKAFYSHLIDLYKIAREQGVSTGELLVGQHKLSKMLDCVEGQLKKAQIDSRIATKFAERANTLASSANIGVAILQRGMAPRRSVVSQEQDLKNKVVLSRLAKENEDIADYFEPILSDEEREILEFARKSAGKN